MPPRAGADGRILGSPAKRQRVIYATKLIKDLKPGIVKNIALQVFAAEQSKGGEGAKGAYLLLNVLDNSGHLPIWVNGDNIRKLEKTFVPGCKYQINVKDALFKEGNKAQNADRYYVPSLSVTDLEVIPIDGKMEPSKMNEFVTKAVKFFTPIHYAMIEAEFGGLESSIEISELCKDCGKGLDCDDSQENSWFCKKCNTDKTEYEGAIYRPFKIKLADGAMEIMATVFHDTAVMLFGEAADFSGDVDEQMGSRNNKCWLVKKQFARYQGLTTTNYSLCAVQENPEAENSEIHRTAAAMESKYNAAMKNVVKMELGAKSGPFEEYREKGDQEDTESVATTEGDSPTDSFDEAEYEKPY